MSTRNIIAYFPMVLVMLLVNILTLFVPSAWGTFQGSDGAPTPPGFTIEPLSLLIGAGIGGLAVDIPLLTRSKHAKTGNVTLVECTGDATSTSVGRKILDYGEAGDSVTPPEEVAAKPGAPIKGISVKGGRANGPITTEASVSGNPIGGLQLKSDKPRPE